MVGDLTVFPKKGIIWQHKTKVGMQSLVRWVNPRILMTRGESGNPTKGLFRAKDLIRPLREYMTRTHMAVMDDPAVVQMHCDQAIT